MSVWDEEWMCEGLVWQHEVYRGLNGELNGCEIEVRLLKKEHQLPSSVALFLPFSSAFTAVPPPRVVPPVH